MTKKRGGSALLIAILLTTVLTLLTVSLSELVTSETRQIGQMIRNGKAQYLAESGGEIAIFEIKTNGPGYQPEENGEPINFPDTDESNPEQFSYTINARTSSLPIKEPYIKDLVRQGTLQKSELFDELLINESVTIPLQTSRFEVQYYLPVSANVNLADWDILLWKLFGQDPINLNATDSMSEFLPASDPTNIGNNASAVGTSAISPARFGTEGGFNDGLFFKYSSGEVEDIPPNEERPRKFIDEFLGGHIQNTLILKNAVNPAQIDLSGTGPTFTFEEASTLKYRVCSPNCATEDSKNEGLVPPFTTINSSGISSGVERRLNTTINREGFLPIFDFSIYRTVN